MKLQWTTIRNRDSHVSGKQPNLQIAGPILVGTKYANKVLSQQSTHTPYVDHFQHLFFMFISSNISNRI